MQFQELDENSRLLSELNSRLQSLGDSLWHTKARKKIKRIRRKNYGIEFLGRYKKK